MEERSFTRDIDFSGIEFLHKDEVVRDVNEVIETYHLNYRIEQQTGEVVLTGQLNFNTNGRITKTQCIIKVGYGYSSSYVNNNYEVFNTVTINILGLNGVCDFIKPNGKVEYMSVVSSMLLNAQQRELNMMKSHSSTMRMTILDLMKLIKGMIESKLKETTVNVFSYEKREVPKYEFDTHRGPVTRDTLIQHHVMNEVEIEECKPLPDMVINSWLFYFAAGERAAKPAPLSESYQNTILKVFNDNKDKQLIDIVQIVKSTLSKKYILKGRWDNYDDFQILLFNMLNDGEINEDEFRILLTEYNEYLGMR